MWLLVEERLKIYNHLSKVFCTEELKGNEEHSSVISSVNLAAAV